MPKMILSTSTRPDNHPEAGSNESSTSDSKPLQTKTIAPLLQVAAIAAIPSTHPVEAADATSTSTCTAEVATKVYDNTSASPDSKGTSAGNKEDDIESTPPKKQRRRLTINEKISSYHEVKALVDRSQNVTVASILKKAGVSKSSYELWGTMISRYEEAVAKNPKVGTLTRFKDPSRKSTDNSKSKSKTNAESKSKSKPKAVYPPYCGIAVAAANAPLTQKRQPRELSSKKSRQNAKREGASAGDGVAKKEATTVEAGGVDKETKPSEQKEKTERLPAEEEAPNPAVKACQRTTDKPKSTAEFETTLQKMQAEVDRLWEENDRLKQTLKKRKREDEAGDELRRENKRLKSELEKAKESSGSWGGCAIS